MATFGHGFLFKFCFTFWFWSVFWKCYFFMKFLRLRCCAYCGCDQDFHRIVLLFVRDFRVFDLGMAHSRKRGKENLDRVILAYFHIYKIISSPCLKGLYPLLFLVKKGLHLVTSSRWKHSSDVIFGVISHGILRTALASFPCRFKYC